MVKNKSLSREKYMDKYFEWQALKSDPRFARVIKKLETTYYKEYNTITRDDIKKLPLNAQSSTIYVGSDDVTDLETFKTKIFPKIKSIFKDTKYLITYIELSSKSKVLINAHKRVKAFGGALTMCHTTSDNHRYAIIHINKKRNNSFASISHELIHASRCINKEDVKNNIDRDEAETALENAVRLPLKYLKDKLKDRTSSGHGNSGYYGLVGGRKSVLQDRQLIKSKCKDTDLRKCIKENIDDTKIGKLVQPKPIRKVIRKKHK